MKRRTWLVVVVLAMVVASVAWLTERAAQRVARRGPGVTAPELTSPAKSSEVAAPVGTAGPSRTAQAAVELSAGQALSEVQSLVGRGKIGAARDLAEVYLKRIPDGPEAARIKSLTGVHPHP